MSQSTQEEQRLASLHGYNILDTPAEEVFDRITNIAKTALHASIALITLIDKDRQWFKSKQGTELSQSARDTSFCSYAIENRDPTIIENLSKDSRFTNNPFVKGMPFLRFYCGIPLRMKDGYTLGTLCVLDNKPRRINLDEMSILIDLSRITIDEIELRHMVDIDYLTGISMRRILFKEGDRAIASSQQSETPFSLIVFEIKHFQNLFEKYGQESAEAVLKATVNAIKPLLGNKDVFARLGNDRFAILMPEISLVKGRELASSVGAAIDTIEVLHASQRIKVSCALGIAAYTPGDNKFVIVLTKAEIALQQAKSGKQEGSIVAQPNDAGQATYSLGTA